MPTAVTPDALVPQGHPIRKIKPMVEAGLARLSQVFDRMYADTERPSILLIQGRICRGYLGVGAQSVRLPAALAEQLGQETGLLLISVDAGSPAEQSGLLLGDTLVALDWEPLRYLDDLMALLNGERVGTAVSVRLVRGGGVQDLRVTIGERS